uniref:Uncharacterized protein n=1 Tax=Glossina austeni TaxID=7395 RepID=A0A1A9VPN6_GLOAU
MLSSFHPMACDWSVGSARNRFAETRKLAVILWEKFTAQEPHFTEFRYLEDVTSSLRKNKYLKFDSDLTDRRTSGDVFKSLRATPVVFSDSLSPYVLYTFWVCQDLGIVGHPEAKGSQDIYVIIHELQSKGTMSGTNLNRKRGWVYNSIVNFKLYSGASDRLSAPSVEQQHLTDNDIHPINTQHITIDIDVKTDQNESPIAALTNECDDLSKRSPKSLSKQTSSLKNIPVAFSFVLYAVGVSFLAVVISLTWYYMNWIFGLPALALALLAVFLTKPGWRWFYIAGATSKRDLTLLDYNLEVKSS